MNLVEKIESLGYTLVGKDENRNIEWYEKVPQAGICAMGGFQFEPYFVGSEIKKEIKEAIKEDVLELRAYTGEGYANEIMVSKELKKRGFKEKIDTNSNVIIYAKYNGDSRISLAFCKGDLFDATVSTTVLGCKTQKDVDAFQKTFIEMEEAVESIKKYIKEDSRSRLWM